MIECLIIIGLTVGGLFFLVWAEEPDDPSFTHECDVNDLVRRSVNKPKENHHRFSSALVYKK